MDTIPTNTDNVIDSRDVIERIEELEIKIEETLDDGIDADDQDELEQLKALADQASNSPDWSYGETLIRYSYFEDYAQELAEDCGMIAVDQNWPNNCIDWEQAANELQMDYFSVDFGGVEYWIRA